jgi:hypothetical protein
VRLLPNRISKGNPRQAKAPPAEGGGDSGIDPAYKARVGFSIFHGIPEAFMKIKADGKRGAVSLFASIVLLSLLAPGQQSTFQDPLLDHMVGTWILQGTIDGKATTHDIDTDWVLGHEYVRLHEVSREKDAKGQAAYEAIVFIGWDQPTGQYACLWLDSTGGGGLMGQAIGHAKRGGDEIAFLFKAGDGSLFHTTFAYDKKADTWEWRMDGEEKGKLQLFARVKLTRK